MNLTLVSMHIEPSARAVPLATAMLAANLGQAFAGRLQTRLADFYLGQDRAECVAEILRQDPDVVGLSVYVWNREALLALATELKARRPQLVLFAGGAEVTAAPSGIEQHPAIDFVLPGEGEEIVVAALRLLQEGCLPAQVGEQLNPSPVTDLATLPSPFLTGLLPPERYPGLLWELSRGCPFRCDFCFESRGSDKVRRFPPERLRAELESFAAAGVRQLFVLDPTFNYHQPQAKQMLRMMAELAPEIHYTIEVRAEFIDEEMAGLFADINCALQIGLQSADPAVLARVHRQFDAEDFTERILLLHEAGVIYGFDLIYGLPGDTLQGFIDSLDFALGLRPNHLDIFPLAVLPGTRLAETANGFGLQYRHQAPYTLLSSPHFSADDMESAAGIARACDLFYNQGRAVPWFDLMLDNLEITPGQFFTSLAGLLPEHDPAGVALIDWQQQVLAGKFRSQDKMVAAALAADVVAWFGYSSALMCGELGQDPGPKEAGRLYLNPDSCFVSFERNPEALLEKLEMGVTDLEVVAMLVAEEPCEGLLYVHQGSVALGIFSPQELSWLKSLQDCGGVRPSDKELAGFCDAALAEGLIVMG
ncbi:radical SAM domain iron-sulfur cluster-binding oxidoreductase with cobalamin-binding-like domain [Syntrophotalea carbinolica DSM 2380]|uniref:Radical SAM domain iron-sulfur cluster-binding oxidoreductase with cobalamin-binding-like domain n=1 Tax=Syntrophotalea carbinolica (strain DSM 2380 / NBRC 103641 / GraBd1) TaxID=338963 RepID=Q3A1N1_SYNC1|nr:B12-binding domain-containing radical SAM protein [Syntrophotalea carbinolica]ABA89726.2 radical SAM domain iron-sulfur cluster-binding oxidoreductase with cobalamin-binding-like domain [Syntrophotalea carbinolica DSM 2380]